MSASAKGMAAAPGRHVKEKAGLNRAILDQGWNVPADAQLQGCERAIDRTQEQLWAS